MVRHPKCDDFCCCAARYFYVLIYSSRFFLATCALRLDCNRLACGGHCGGMPQDDTVAGIRLLYPCELSPSGGQISQVGYK